MPFYVVDGVNSNNVCVSMNVVPKERGENLRTIPNIEEKYEIQESAIPRFVLDNFKSAEEAANYLRDYVSIYPNKALANSEYDTHYIIGDLNQAFIVELIDNKVVVKEVRSNDELKPIITNFHILTNVDADTIKLSGEHVYTPETAVEGKYATSQGITTHGSGLERYNIVVDNYNDLSNFRDLVYYNKSYYSKKQIKQPWYSEFVGVYRDGFTLTVDSTPDDYEGTDKDYKVMSIVRKMYKNRTRKAADT